MRKRNSARSSSSIAAKSGISASNWGVTLLIVCSSRIPVHVVQLFCLNQIIGMPHSGYPCSEQAHKSSFHTPETKQQERDNKRRRHYGGSVHDQVAWIPREKAHQEGDEIIDSSRIRSCQKAKPTADG